MLNKKDRNMWLGSVFAALFLAGLSTAKAAERWKQERVLDFLSQHTCSFKVYDESGVLTEEYDLNRQMAEYPDSTLIRDYLGDQIGAIEVAEHSTFLAIPITRTIAVISFESGPQGLKLHIANEGIDVGVREWSWNNLETFVQRDFTYESEGFMTKQRQVFRCD